MNHSINIKPLLLVETTYITKSYPSEIKEASSIIYDYLNEVGNEKAIDKYGLWPFKIRVQALERTLIDKVFAICDYMIGKRIERNSRHIYDLAMILDKVRLNEKLKDLVKVVRNERKLNSYCYSAQDGISIQKLLEEIISSQIYKKDYETITKAMMFKYLSYEEAIKAIEIIIESGVFE